MKVYKEDNWEIWPDLIDIKGFFTTTLIPSLRHYNCNLDGISYSCNKKLQCVNCNVYAPEKMKILHTLMVKI